MKRRSGMGRQAPVRPAAPGSRAFPLWIPATVLLFTVLILLWLRPFSAGPRLPFISTNLLEAPAAAVLQHHLDSVRAQPRSGTAWGQLGALLRSLEFAKEARYCLETAERLDPHEARWSHLLALQLMKQSPRDAVARFRRAADRCGIQPDAPRLRLAKLLAETGDWQQMEQTLQPLLQAEPEHGPALLALARAAQARGDFEAAIALATRSAVDPRTAQGSWSLLAALYQRQGQIQLALDAGQKAARAPPDAPLTDPFETEVAFQRADSRQFSDRIQQLLMNRRFHEAAPLLQQLVRDHPQFSEGWLLLGRWYLLQNQLPQAELAIQRHLQLDSQSVNGLFQLGLTQMQGQRLTEAAATFQQATRLKPDFSAGFFNLGLVLVRSGRQPEAIAPLREAIRNSPEHFESYLLLADVYRQLAQDREARTLVRQAEGIDPNDRRLVALREKLERP